MEKKPSAIRNYGIVLRYLSRTLNINMYREYRDTTLSNAISQMCKTQNLLFRHGYGRQAQSKKGIHPDHQDLRRQEEGCQTPRNQGIQQVQPQVPQGQEIVAQESPHQGTQDSLQGIQTKDVLSSCL